MADLAPFYERFGAERVLVHLYGDLTELERLLGRGPLVVAVTPAQGSGWPCGHSFCHLNPW